MSGGGDSGQQAVIGFLADPKAFGLPPETNVARQETHVSHIFLAGDRAYKLKKQVRYPYLDFSTLEARRRACETEVTINRRTAPAIYLGTVAVTDEGGGCLALGGAGDPVDWLVEMRRFPDGALFTHLADAGALNRRLMEELADGIQAFHAAAEIDREHGGAAGIRAIIDNNDASFRDAQGGLFNADDVDALTDGSRQLQDSLAGLLDARRDGGRVRHCHGDLHLANICLFEDKPTLFDAIEFNEAFARIDVLYDLAFLLMDLDLRGHRRLASFVLNRYLDRAPLDGGDLDGLALLPLFLSMRRRPVRGVRCGVAEARGKGRDRSPGRAAQGAVSRPVGRRPAGRAPGAGRQPARQRVRRRGRGCPPTGRGRSGRRDLDRHRQFGYAQEHGRRGAGDDPRPGVGMTAHGANWHKNC